jgi:hypothetical protein
MWCVRVCVYMCVMIKFTVLLSLAASRPEALLTVLSRTQTVFAPWWRRDSEVGGAKGIRTVLYHMVPGLMIYFLDDTTKERSTTLLPNGLGCWVRAYQAYRGSVAGQYPQLTLSIASEAIPHKLCVLCPCTQRVRNHSTFLIPMRHAS